MTKPTRTPTHQPGRGGPRPNAGRTRTAGGDAGPARTYSIRLPADTVDALRELRTLDVRWLLEQLADAPAATLRAVARRRKRASTD